MIVEFDKTFEKSLEIIKSKQVEIRIEKRIGKSSSSNFFINS
jgi:hypothetical protein